jgi:cholesterol transport system auxiliary component
MRSNTVTLVCRPLLLLAAALLLTACAGLPERAAAPLRYDFGPAPVPASVGANRPVLALRVQASPALEGHAMLYRLAYADAQQLRAYSQARWAMAPAELLEQRLRSGLGRDYTLPPGGEGAARVLHVELEEFSQVYATPEQSRGLLRLRVSLLQRSAPGEQLLAQRELLFQQAAARPDAAAGVRALGASTDEAVTELVQWLRLHH